MVKRDYPARAETRVWRADVDEDRSSSVALVAPVRDEGMRAYLETERRALLMKLAAIERVLGTDTTARPRAG